MTFALGAALLFVGCLLSAVALDNGVGLTPAMGYNTWDDFRCEGVNASNIEKVADAFIRYGLDKFGYQYIGIDDCWAVSRSKTSGVILEDPKAFPRGMKAVVDYVHMRGLKFGIYTDRGTATCVGRPGSQGFEKVDAETYASWGVDLVKEDSCNAPTDHEEAFRQYGLMRDALNATGRPIYFALCGWSDWYAPAGRSLGNSWRYGYDVNDWHSAWSNAISSSSRLAQYAGPGAWNDPDALIGSSPGAAVHISEVQSRTQFSLWAVMAAPLEIGSNILNLSAYDLETLTNAEVIAVDQDPDGIQGKVVWDSCEGQDALRAFRRSPSQRAQDRRAFAQGAAAGGSCTAIPSCQQIWLRPLRDGYALAFVNYTQGGRPGAALRASRGQLRLAACDAADEAQLWNVRTTGAMSTIAASAGDEGCWEVNGCNYAEGSSVDTDFGCKPLPAPGLEDPCCSNMAFNISAEGAITSVFSGLCFEIGDHGGSLRGCTRSKAQTWKFRGSKGRQQIVSATGSSCVSRVQQSDAAAVQADPDLVFDVLASLGWHGAMVRDLWAHKDIGLHDKVSVRLNGNGDSRLFKLTKPSAEISV